MMQTSAVLKLLPDALKKILLILIAILMASVFLAAFGYDFFAVFKGIGLGITSDIGTTIRWMTPLLFTGLAVCLSQKAKLFNLGADGQLYLGAIATTWIVLKFTGAMPSVLGIVIGLIAGIIAGMIFAMIPAALRILFGADEIVTTLLLNFVGLLFTNYLVFGPMLAKNSMTAANTTDKFAEQFWLPRISYLQPSQANIGLYIAIAFAVALAFVMFKTKLGYEVKIAGSNSNLAVYSGISANRLTFLTLSISGGMAGLAGSVEVLGCHHRFPAGFNNNIGFDGIVVSLIAANNPITCIFAAFFLAALKNGCMNLERISDVPSSVSEIVQAIMMIVITMGVGFPMIKDMLKRFQKSDDGKKSVGIGGESGDE
jgi:simple sugar transport system permease protein